MKTMCRVLAGIAFALTLCTMPMMAFAANGDGTGGGNGGGGNNAPTLSSSEPADGATVSAEDAEEIWLHFNVNVAEASIAEDNISKVHLQQADGTDVAAIVGVADLQVEPDKKRDMFIVPDQPLDEGEYVIVIEEGITAKNGNSSTEKYLVSFTVEAGGEAAVSDDSASSGAAPAASTSASSASAASASAASASASAASKSASSANASATSASASSASAPAASASSTSPSSSSASSAAPDKDKSSEQGISPIVWVVLAVVAVAIIVAFVVRKRNAPADSADGETSEADNNDNTDKIE